MVCAINFFETGIINDTLAYYSPVATSVTTTRPCYLRFEVNFTFSLNDTVGDFLYRVNYNNGTAFYLEYRSEVKDATGTGIDLPLVSNPLQT